MRRVLQLVIGCVLLGAGVALVLDARLGSDGYSMLVSGLSLWLGVEFWIVNVVTGVTFISMAWLRGRRPGIGTLVQPVLVGVVVSVLLPLLPTPSALGPRVVEFVVAFTLLCVGVAAYLAADLGAGPAEAAGLAWDPPLPFRWSYSGVQLVGAAVGFLCGAALGVGTVVVVLLIGPVVDKLVPVFRSREPATPAGRSR